MAEQPNIATNQNAPQNVMQAQVAANLPANQPANQTANQTANQAIHHDEIQKALLARRQYIQAKIQKAVKDAIQKRRKEEQISIGDLFGKVKRFFGNLSSDAQSPSSSSLQSIRPKDTKLMRKDCEKGDHQFFMDQEEQSSQTTPFISQKDDRKNK